ncbi:MAG: UDP-N-acetylglucosamine 2-epimerase (non-hydrolyzing) [Pirellulales bacterium]
MSNVNVLFVFGTRPEAIKLAPLILACAQCDQIARSIVCTTGQHREMLTGVLEYFGVAVDVDLELMRPDQSLADLTARALQGVRDTIAQRRPDCVVVQGDTTTAMAAALAAFYERVPVVHVEAGLRTGNLLAPWPEELNRRIVTLAAAVHCAPTQRAADALAAEGVSPAHIHVTGNTVVDALLSTVARERQNAARWQAKYAALGDARLVLITGHRRENFGGGLAWLCQAIGQLAAQFPNVQFIYPVHLNPNVLGPVRAALSGLPNVQLAPPAPYPEFVWLMDRATLILTDSGGIQEEAPSLGKPVLVMRDSTERPEALAGGLVELVGTRVELIVERASRLLSGLPQRERPPAANPYGDGHAAGRIVRLIAERAWTA